MEFPVTNLYKLDSRVFKVTSYLNKRFVLIVNAHVAIGSVVFRLRRPMCHARLVSPLGHDS